MILTILIWFLLLFSCYFLRTAAVFGWRKDGRHQGLGKGKEMGADAVASIQMG